MVTEAGRARLDRKRIAYTPVQGKSGPSHQFWQFAAKSRLERQGWRAVIEQRLRGKYVEVGAERDGASVAYAIVQEGSLEKEVSNFHKDLADGWRTVAFCVDYDRTGRPSSGACLTEPQSRFGCCVSSFRLPTGHPGALEAGAGVS